MLVRPVDFNGMIQNANSVSSHENNNNTRSELQQSMITEKTDINNQDTLTKVHTDIDTAKEEFVPDRDGDGTGYDGGRRRKKKNEDKKSNPGRVIKKGEAGSFDVKI